MAVLPAMFVIITTLVLLFSQISSSTDTLNQSQALVDGNTLVSEDGSFELGFFSPGGSTHRYVGIWYKNVPIKTVVWVANRNNPIKNDNSSMLTISKEGNLVLVSHSGTVYWSTNATTTTKASSSAIAQLLDSGNLVLRDETVNNTNPQVISHLWQSFDYPCDTFLPGMKLGWNLKTGLDRRITSWKNWDDPAAGDFVSGFLPTNNPEVVTWNGSTEYFRSGPWDGIQLSGLPSLKTNQLINRVFVWNKDELYYTYSITNKSVISRVVINQTAYALQRSTWIEKAQKWIVASFVPRDYCDNYNVCGPFGNCVVGDTSSCLCLLGFRPKSLQNWIAMDWSQGCVHSETWSCRKNGKDGFQKFSNMKSPDTKKSWVNATMTLEECKAKCWENCSCTAFANSNISGEGSGCVIWFGDLLDLREMPGAGQDLYIRLASKEIGNQAQNDGLKKRVAVVASSTASSLVAMLLIFTFIYKRSCKTEIRGKADKCEQEDLELPLFDLVTIRHATNDFSTDRKLGEGGFGPVYKGTLRNGQDVAVKRLSRKSSQGIKEFKNEVILCAKLQHRNLVKVLGCCIQNQEKLLIYEYMPNKSLDSHLFDFTRRKLLNWSRRFYIINGIARGLLYLHQDSRLRIIHRDLKASNVLLDNEMNPKISDFGLARMCGGDQVEGNTSRVAGTYGYMAPEYVFDGIFSIKSDVFSFGVMLLEIISGKKNRWLSYPKHSSNLIGQAWKMWKEGISYELIDACLKDSCILSDAIRCIHIGLLCLQHHPNDRPNMALVVLMLSSPCALPEPKEPGFLIGNASVDGKPFSEKHTSSATVNEVTLSMLDAR